MALAASGAAAPAQPVPAQPAQPALTAATAPPGRVAVLAEILSWREVAGGYALRLKAIRSFGGNGRLAVTRFDATLPLGGLPSSLRLFLLLDVTNPRRPRPVHWTYIVQHICLDTEAIGAYGLEPLLQGGWERNERERCNII